MEGTSAKFVSKACSITSDRFHSCYSPIKSQYQHHNWFGTGKFDDAPDTLPTARCECSDNFWFPLGLPLYIISGGAQRARQITKYALTPRRRCEISMLKKRDEVDRTFGGWVRGLFVQGSRHTWPPLDARRSTPNNRGALYYLIISRPDKIIARCWKREHRCTRQHI